MTSLVNKYFNKQPKNEQALVQSLMTEAIAIMGITCYYMPRKMQKLDLVFGEDPASKFTSILPIEMYIETSAGWEGQSELLTKFGLEIRNKITFSVSSSRWAKEVLKIKSDMWATLRPQEGDLIYDTITQKIFEIKFVEQDWDFYQLGKRSYAYKMQCEMFQYSGETIQTGVTDIDTAVDQTTTNYVDLEILKEDGGVLLQEDGASLTKELFIDATKIDTSPVLQDEATKIEWDVNNPFKNL